MMDGYFVTQDIDTVHFKGKNKSTARKFHKIKNLKEIENKLGKNNKPYYVYSGTAKPLDIWGVYRFIDGKLKRISNETYNFSEE